MPHWYYRGRVTTPVNIPGVGSVVLRPNMRFEAPEASVAHLKRMKPPMVVEVAPPKTPVAAVPAPTQEVVQPPLAQTTDKIASQDDAPVGQVVVASELTAPEEKATDEVATQAEPVEEMATEEGGEDRGKKTWSRKRRGG